LFDGTRVAYPEEKVLTPLGHLGWVLGFAEG
jgi:hypothetical protein